MNAAPGARGRRAAHVDAVAGQVQAAQRAVALERRAQRGRRAGAQRVAAQVQLGEARARAGLRARGAPTGPRAPRRPTAGGPAAAAGGAARRERGREQRAGAVGQAAAAQREQGEGRRVRARRRRREQGQQRARAGLAQRVAAEVLQARSWSVSGCCSRITAPTLYHVHIAMPRRMLPLCQAGCPSTLANAEVSHYPACKRPRC